MTKAKCRLYTSNALANGASVSLDETQAHYLMHVLRAKQGETVALFNGADGEWVAEVENVSKREVSVRVQKQIAPFKASPDIWLVFAPVKNEKIDFLVKRAVELGVSKMIPVKTQHTIVTRINQERLQANAIEAAEQSGRLDVPALEEMQTLPHVLGSWQASRSLLFCDESGAGVTVRELLPNLSKGAYAVLIGPEGGFSKEEQMMLKSAAFVKGMSLGPRILRAETAALAALANVQAWLGDWDEKPKFEGQI